MKLNWCLLSRTQFLLKCGDAQAERRDTMPDIRLFRNINGMQPWQVARSVMGDASVEVCMCVNVFFLFYRVCVHVSSKMFHNKYLLMLACECTRVQAIMLTQVREHHILCLIFPEHSYSEHHLNA